MHLTSRNKHQYWTLHYAAEEAACHNAAAKADAEARTAAQESMERGISDNDEDAPEKPWPMTPAEMDWAMNDFLPSVSARLV